MLKLAFIGLGVMGYPMAGHLATAGHTVSVYNRTENKADRWCAQFAGTKENTPAEAARGVDVAFSCVGDDDDLRAVVLGDDGIFAGLPAGAVLVDHSTTSSEVARELAAVGAESDLGFVDAPVSGGQIGAEDGALTIMCGADLEQFRKVQPVIASYANTSVLMGEVGSGQLTKMVNQICIAGLVQALAEGINFGIKAGLDMEKVIDVISKGAAQSWQMDNRAGTMCDNSFDFGFAVDWMRKDLSIAFAAANKYAARLPVAVLVDQFYAQLQEQGGQRWDTSSLIHLLSQS